MAEHHAALSPAHVPRLRRIAYLFPANSIMNRVADGLFRYSLAWRDWQITVGMLTPAELRRLPQEVLVGMFNHREIYERYRPLGVPMIALLGLDSDIRLPSVVVDHEAVGRMAAEYLLGLGFRHFGFIGYPARQHVEPYLRLERINVVEIARREAFKRALGRRAASFSVAPGVDLYAEDWRQPLVNWLRAQPKPLAVLCTADDVGRRVLDACRSANLPVPEQISVLGINDDDHECRWARPQLSSIAIPWEQIGMTVGELIDRFFRTGRLPARTIRIPPTGVIARGSTARAAPDDPVVAGVLAALRARSHEPINLKQLFADFPVKRRQLERRFHALVGRTPLAELWRLRVEHARELLADTRLGYGEVAQACGFSSSTHLARVFRKLTGERPQDYRQRQRRAR